MILLLAVAVTGANTYLLWQEGPWEMPRSAAAKPPGGSEAGLAKPAERPVLASTKDIVEKNLFDPERGANRSGEVVVGAGQKVRNLILLGTAVIGNSRYAILQQPSDSPGKAPAAGQIRLKVGDSFEGFRVSEIEDRRVVFAQGASQVEVALDFFRKVEDPRGAMKAPVPARPRIPPRIPVPRREAAGQGSTKAQAE